MLINLDVLQPSEKVLSERKLARCRWKYKNGIYITNQVVIMPYFERWAIVNGNHTTYAYHEAGEKELEAVVQDQRDASWIDELRWQGITKIADLSDKIISHRDWRKIFPYCNNFEDALTDEDFFKRYPELKEYCKK